MLVRLLVTLAIADFLDLVVGLLGKLGSLLSTFESAVKVTLGVDSSEFTRFLEISLLHLEQLRWFRGLLDEFLGAFLQIFLLNGTLLLER